MFKAKADVYKVDDRQQGLCRADATARSTVRADHTKRQPETFAEVAAAWLAASRIEWKESTRVRYTNLLLKYLVPAFGSERIAAIKGRDVENFCIRLRLSGKADGSGLSEKTTADILSVLRRVFRYADRENLCVDRSVYLVGIKCTTKPLHILSIAEQQTLYRYLKGDPDPINLGILLCMNTGIRVGELCALEWKDISVCEKTLYIHQTMQRLQKESSTDEKTHVVITSPKSPCANRLIPLTPDVFQLLKKYPLERNGYFLTGCTEKIVEPRKVQYRFQKILKRCGIAPVNFHVLRHTFATRCVEADVDIKTLSEILGHSTVSITMNRYVHPSLDLKRISMNKFSNYVSLK